MLSTNRIYDSFYYIFQNQYILIKYIPKDNNFEKNTHFITLDIFQKYPQLKPNMFSSPSKSCLNKFHLNLKMAIVVMCDDYTRCLILKKCVCHYGFGDVETKKLNKMKRNLKTN
jgi:hypothetical protein